MLSVPFIKYAICIPQYGASLRLVPHVNKYAL
jgi:hypothetical protein